MGHALRPSLLHAWAAALLMFPASLLLPVGGAAQDVDAANGGQTAPKEAGARMADELIAGELAGTQRKYEMEISISPRIEDVLDKPVIAFPLRLKFGFTAHLESFMVLDTFVNNPLREESDEGISDVVLGLKYRWRKLLTPHVATATSFSLQLPAGDGEVLSDEFIHYRPQITFTKSLKGRHRVQLSATLGMDIITDSSQSDEEPPDNPLRVAFGLLYPSPPRGYTFEAEWVTTETDGGGDNIFYLTPGMQWNILPRDDPRWYSGWEAGLGLRFGLGDAEDDFRVITRIKWDFPLGIKYRKDLRELMGEPPPGAPIRLLGASGPAS